jgi:transaldolase
MNYLKNMKIKIFADGANLDSIKEFNLNNNISGFTTNPSLMKKAGIKDYKTFSLDVLKIIGNKPVSLEQVKEIYSISENNTEVIISIFAGRVADTGIDPNKIMIDSVNLCKSKNKIKILWASTRELLNIFQADKIGCHIITVPNEILKKTSYIGKNLNELSLETVKTFLVDATNAGFEIKINK